MRLANFILFMSICFCAPVYAINLSEALDIAKLIKDVVVTIGKSWNLLDEHFDASEVPLPLINKRERTIFNKLDMINRKVTLYGNQLDTVREETVSTLLKILPEEIRLDLKSNDLTKLITKINIAYARMSSYTKTKAKVERSTLEDFATWVISPNPNSVLFIIERIHAFFVPHSTGISDSAILTPLTKVMTGLPSNLSNGVAELKHSWIWARAYGELITIHAMYEAFKRFQTQQTATGRIPSPKQAWSDLAETILNDPKSSIPQTSDNLMKIIIDKKLFRNALLEVDGQFRCNMNQSPQQMILNLYNIIALTEIKGYSMVQFAYMILKLHNKGNFTEEAEIQRQRYEERSKETLAAVKESIKVASRDLWKCDPKKHISNETFIEITELLQGYLQNEVDLNPEGTCRDNCAEYTYTKSHGCYKNLYCQSQRRCAGKIINCQYIDSDSWVCPADPKTNRRYEYIEYENGRTLGRKMGCDRGQTKVDSWWRWLFWHCSYCMCLCDEQGTNSDRFINMRTTESNMEDNRVVTGLRFVKKNRIIHLQVQEGKLLPQGAIDLLTVRWVPVEDYKIQDRGFASGQDFHTLTWDERALDLDDLEAGQGELLTGVRFKLIGSHLNFEIRVTPFDYASGQVHGRKSYWKDNSNTDVASSNPRRKLSLYKPDNSTRTTSPSTIDSQSNQYVEFTNSDLDKDVAQTTVPFFDAQPVSSLLPVPLSGAGIYHKGQAGFGGFIGAKIITFDVHKLLENAINDISPDEHVN